VKGARPLRRIGDERRGTWGSHGTQTGHLRGPGGAARQQGRADFRWRAARQSASGGAAHGRGIAPGRRAGIALRRRTRRALWVAHPGRATTVPGPGRAGARPGRLAPRADAPGPRHGRIHAPSTKSLDREEKRPVYAREGVRHVWLLDPRTRTLEVFRPSAPSWPLPQAPCSPPPHLLGDAKWPQFGAWSEDAVEPREVCPRRRHQGRHTP